MALLLACARPVSVPPAQAVEASPAALAGYDHVAREHYLRALVAIERGQLDQAQEHLRRARLFDPESALLRAEEARLRALAQDPG